MSEALLSISFNELCQLEGIESQLIIEIVEYEIVSPLNKQQAPNDQQWLFDTSSIHWIKKALRLRHDLEIDWVAIAIVIKLMRQKEALQKENDAIRRQLRRFVKNEIN
ncbi:hypothetical protein tinsulaeT_21030 [Thalassotalea insulae]|uniref:Chaperone modulatory protein CbpM n=1 Tax=Thalassotalea insulae TaxID=2056778 RepID=A0ABQ6GS57_9GAMM|nr:chaperone modulator CbpM [Thalassotalea insulae]GLX78763.1 hypothetical protein tinsulaeT_21030 [Thalassotalea insulae]